MSYRSFKKIEEELSNDKPNLEIIRKELDKIKEDISDLEWDKQDLEDQISELESEVYDLESDLKDFKKQNLEDHTLDDYFLDKIIEELRHKWRYSSTKLEQKLKESDLI
jgi:predicted  nucleic acid-binding Zn-ribbon protein